MSDEVERERWDGLWRVLDERDRRVTQKFDDMQEAIGKAETASEKRFDAVNEFRSTLSDQAATLISRREVEAMLQTISTRVSDLGQQVDRNTGRDSGIGVGWSVLLGICSVLALFTAIFAVFERLTTH